MRIFANQNLLGNRIWNLPVSPKYGSEAPSINYVLSLFGVATTFAPVVAVATTDVALSGTGSTITIDGVEIVDGDRVLLAGTGNTASDANNGIMVFTVSGGNYSFARASDADTSAELVSGSKVLALSGNANGKKIWTLVTPDPITLGTTALEFTASAVVSTGVKKAVVELTGDGTTKTFTVAHNLNTEDYTVDLWYAGEKVFADVAKIYDNSLNVDLNNVTVKLGMALAVGEKIRVVVEG